MLITPLPPHHNLVLNKFAIVPEHFILATSAFKPQTHLLEADDLAATYACIKAYGAEGKELFAFFNSGEHSGASQPHRHVQMMEVARMREGLEEGEGWGVLADRLVATRPPAEDDGREKESVVADQLPFRVFAEALDADDVDPQTLHQTYLRLYAQARDALLRDDDGNGSRDCCVAGEHQEEAEISYNMAMTRSALVICPRVAEGSEITTTTSDDEITNADGGSRSRAKVVGKLALNGTVLAGTALVKSQAEWDALRKGEPDMLGRLLEGIGLPWSAGGRTTDDDGPGEKEKKESGVGGNTAEGRL